MSKAPPGSLPAGFARPNAMTIVVRALLLLVVLGATVGAAWTAIGGPQAWQGGIEQVIRDRGLVLYGVIAAISAVVLFMLVRARWSDATLLQLAGIVALAWIGEGLALTLFGHRLDDDIRPESAWYYWLVATGFGIQPVAAFLGAVIARQRSGT